MVALFTAAIFVAAFLLFMIQPLAARLVLPQLGGSPAVWTGTMMFFQFLLLGGYAYAHALSRLRPLPQGVVHGVVMLSCVVFLPLSLPMWWSPDMGPPLVSLLVALAGGVGLPFFAISATSPLVQAWFARTGHARAHDPYFLYVASNAGSLLGLLAYPLIVERALGLSSQGWAWAIGFGVCALLVGGAWALSLRGRAPSVSEAPLARSSVPSGSAKVARRGARKGRSARAESPARAEPTPAALDHAEVSPWAQRLTWIVLAAAPSSLSLGVTQFLTTDVAAVPMLWVLPLGLYLTTYIVAFSKRSALGEQIGRIVLPVATIAATSAIMLQAVTPLLMIGGLHLLVLAAAGLACHGRLAALRPRASRLTEFYLLASLGGALGGAFNAVVAPLVFDVVLEYPLAIAACCALLAVAPPTRPKEPREGGGLVRRWSAKIGAWAGRQPRLVRLMAPLAAAVLASIYLVLADIVLTLLGIEAGRAIDGVIPGRMVVTALTVGLPLLVAFLLFRFRFVFAAIIATLAGQATLVPFLGARLSYEIVLIDRSFFGVCIVLDRQGFVISDGAHIPPLRILRHGTTTHGQQFLDPERRHEPLSYYARVGPVGSTFERLPTRPRTIAMVGLGTGTVAAYGRPADRFDFFEIDPIVVQLAQDPNVFTYLSDARSTNRVIVGDGRLRLGEQEAESYDLIILDAFSSDSIPIHLLTREAFEVYVSRLRPDGVLLVHISNLHFDLLKPVARAGADLGLHMARRSDAVSPRQAWVEAILSSHWVVLTRDRAVLDRFGAPQGWERVARPDHRPPWTDDHADVLEVMYLN